ncbi:MAG: prolipoprotein diacylglyceryl transferase [Lachnospiraceae bacterium]|nr:prolipoprotein diacylglyceryl transferase [Lachnospiraceae bacterium]
MDIRFPNLGWLFENVPDGFTIFGIELKLYGLIISLGFLLGYLSAYYEAKRTKQDPDLYTDYVTYMVIPAIIGARMYYVIFAFDKYKDNLWEIFNIRAGGLAIYGGIIACVITLVVFAKKRKQNIFLMSDTCAMGLLIGQILGRWGNFFNREAYGGYTDSLFAMAIPVQDAQVVNEELLSHLVYFDGIPYIQVHPTFLYESLWNLGLLIIIFFYRKHKKFHGEITAIYFLGYGIGRFWIEGLRQDQLILATISGVAIPVSQLLAAIMVVVSVVFIIYGRKKKRIQPGG